MDSPSCLLSVVCRLLVAVLRSNVLVARFVELFLLDDIHHPVYSNAAFKSSINRGESLKTVPPKAIPKLYARRP